MRGHKEMKKREEKKGTLRSQREVQKFGRTGTRLRAPVRGGLYSA